MRTPYASLLLFAAALLAVGQNPSYRQDPQWIAPEAASAKANPLAGKPELSAGGKKLFVRNCAECHGPNGAGMETKRSADLQLPLVQQQSDGTLFWKITSGNAPKGMPAFSKLPELQRWQLVLFLRTLKRTGPAAADPAK